MDCLIDDNGWLIMYNVMVEVEAYENKIIDLQSRNWYGDLEFMVSLTDDDDSVAMYVMN